MKVSFLVGTLERGGAEKQLMFMLEAARRAGVETRVLCLTRNESYEAEIESLGVPVEWVGKPRNRLMRLAKIIRCLQKNPPDILQSSHFYTNIYAGLAGKFLNIPSIGAIRSDLISEIKIHGRLGNWQVSLPRFLIANSQKAYQNAMRRGIEPRQIAFVRNVVKTNGNHPVKKNEIVLLFAGRLDAMKRPEKFINLARALTEKNPEIPLRFLIAGDGILRKNLEKQSAEMKLSPGRLKFLGVSREMDALYSRADILVSTSVREGTSNVILEAMAHGLPVVATKTGGTPEILNERRGILVSPDDEKELLNAAEKLIFDPDLRNALGGEGRKYVEENHSPNYLKKRLTEIYEGLLN